MASSSSLPSNAALHSVKNRDAALFALVIRGYSNSTAVACRWYRDGMTAWMIGCFRIMAQQRKEHLYAISYITEPESGELTPGPSSLPESAS